MEIKVQTIRRGFAALMVTAFATGYLAAGLDEQSADAHGMSVADYSASSYLQTVSQGRSTAALGNAKADGQITWAVKSELLAAPELQSSSIVVETQDAKVTLSGAVSHEGQARQAIEVARRVTGVKHINSRLVVNDGESSREIEAMWRRLSI